MKDSLDRLNTLVEWLKWSKRTVIMTGAGVSAGSGLSTFRGPTQKDDAEAAYWNRFDPMEMASEAGFRANPERVWQWYQWRRQQVIAAKPNAAHLAIAKLQQQLPITLITQNVDGLHHLAGSPSVCALHGEIMLNKCASKNCDFITKVDDTECSLINCPQCSEDWLRPGVVWFGESLNPHDIATAETASYSCQLFISVGTSSLVYPAAGFAQLAKSQGARLVEINLTDTDLSSLVDLAFNHTAADVFESLDKHF